MGWGERNAAGRISGNLRRDRSHRCLRVNNGNGGGGDDANRPVRHRGHRHNNPPRRVGRRRYRPPPQVWTARATSASPSRGMTPPRNTSTPPPPPPGRRMSSHPLNSFRWSRSKRSGPTWRLGTKWERSSSTWTPTADRCPTPFPPVVDLRLTLSASSLSALTGPERGYEMYSPFTSATLTPLDDPTTVLWEGRNPGRIRPKGQSTMYLGVCTDRTTPYQIDWDSDNSTATMMGMTKTYLRTAWGDGSFSREWVAHRMLARFGLPHLRTRSVRLLMNEVVVGTVHADGGTRSGVCFCQELPRL